MGTGFIRASGFPVFWGGGSAGPKIFFDSGVMSCHVAAGGANVATCLRHGPVRELGKCQKECRNILAPGKWVGGKTAPAHPPTALAAFLGFVTLLPGFVDLSFSLIASTRSDTCFAYVWLRPPRHTEPGPRSPACRGRPARRRGERALSCCGRDQQAIVPAARGEVNLRSF